MPQHDDAIQVIQERALEKNASECIILSDTDIESIKKYPIGLQGDYQYQNACLAIHLCQKWLSLHHEHSIELKSLTKEMQQGLLKVHWPGRSQVVRHAKCHATWFLDGAHTPESIEVN